MKRITLSSIALLLFVMISSNAQLRITPASRTAPLGFNTSGGAAEITAYDPVTKQLYCVNGNTNEIAVYDFTNPRSSTPLVPTALFSVSGSGSINSIACHQGLLAVVYENQADRTQSGFVQLYTTTGNASIGTPITVGAQPDMITFTPNGRKLLIANEGEPNNFYTVDPEGSITIIDVTNPSSPATTQLSLTSLNGTVPHLSTQPTTMPSVRIFGMINSLESTVAGFAMNNTKTPSTVAQDLEPEYITVSPDGATAWVSCQENNAVLIINVNAGTITTLVGLGYKDHSLVGNGMDISRTPTNNSAVNIARWPFKGMYQPDGISVSTIGGIPYLFTANEGDAREYLGFNEELDVNAAFGLRMNSGNFTATQISAITLAGIRITNSMGNTNGGLPYFQNSLAGANINVGNNFEEIYTYGTRSFSIWNGLTGALVWDSGDQLERQTLAAYPSNFNADHNGGSANNIRRRSTSKGPEPESIVTGMIGDSLYAFIGLERIGGVMVYNVSNPIAPFFKQYINTRDFSLAATAVNSATGNDLGPEGLTLIKASESPDGKAYLVVSNEISGTLRIFALENPIVTINPTLFTIAANQSISAVQTMNLNGTGLPTPISVNAPTNFEVSLSSTTGFGNSVSVVNTGSLVNLPVFVRYIGTSAFESNLVSISGNLMAFAPVTLTGTKITTTTGAATYTLQMLHASDFEAGLAAMDNAPRFAAIWSKFNADYPNTLRVSGGDNFLPSPFFNAAADGTLRTTFANINNGYLGATNGVNFREGIGRGDINIMNLLDLHASAVGNHEFDAGTGTFLEMIGVGYNDATNPTQVRWAGTRFPYLSCNLDFSGDANLAPLYTSEIRSTDSYKIGPTPASILALSANQRRKIAPATVITIGGEVIGIIGATTQIVTKISSTGGVVVRGTNVDDMPLLASQIQLVVDELRARGINKIVLLSHLQQISNEKALAPLLSGVDIIVAAGSHTLMSDADDILEGDTQADVYPFISNNNDGTKTMLVSTAAEYSYVGRLVIDFDAAGNVIPISYNTAISGAWKTTDTGMNRASVNTITAFTGTTPAFLTKGIVEGINVSVLQPNAITLSGVTLTLPGIRGIVNGQDGNILGKTQVFIEGRREQVRLQETNLGNLSADANLAEARKLFPDVMISLKNGGGIRAAIGVISAVGGNFVLSPPLANPSAGKLAGDISQLDILNALRFNNLLSVGQVSAANMLVILNHAVAASNLGATPGQFAQVGGIRYSWNRLLPAGSRIRSAAVVDLMGNVIDVIAENGAVVGDPSRLFRTVTLNFMLNNGGAGTVGGDSYPLNSATFTNRVDLGSTVTINGYNTVTGAATFGTVGGEQDAFAKFMRANYSTTGYNVQDTPEAQDLRIQNLGVRTEAILPTLSMPLATISGIVNQTLTLPMVSISGARFVPSTVITATAPANVSINGMNMVTVSGFGENVSVSALLPNVVGTTTFVITLTAANFTQTFTHTINVVNQNPIITFNGFNMTVGGSNIDLSTLLMSNSVGTKTFSIIGSAASISGNNLVAISAGSVTVTGTIGTATGFNAGSMMAVFTVSNQNPTITFNGINTTVGGSNVDLSTLLMSNSTGSKTFSINGSAASISGNNLVAINAGTVTVTGTIGTASGFNAGAMMAVFTVSNQNTIITFNGFNMTVGGSIDLGALLISNSPGAQTFSVNGIAASLSGSNLIALSQGVVVVTGSIASTTGFNALSASVEVTVVSSINTSIESEIVSTFVLYPNPVTGGILYFSTPISGSIYNTLGVEVKQFKNASSVNVASLAPGIYLLKSNSNVLKIFIIE